MQLGSSWTQQWNNCFCLHPSPHSHTLSLHPSLPATPFELTYICVTISFFPYTDRLFQVAGKMAPAICFHVFPRSVAQRQRPYSCSKSKVFEEGIWVAYLGSYCSTPVARAGKVLLMAPAKVYDWNGVGMILRKARAASKIGPTITAVPSSAAQHSMRHTPVCSHTSSSQCPCLMWSTDLTLTRKLPLGSQVHPTTVIISKISVCCVLSMTDLAIAYRVSLYITHMKFWV